METSTIAQYYREPDPLKRKAILEESIQAGEDPEDNAIRREIWDMRYQNAAEIGNGERADGFLGLWMTMEFNRNAGNKFFGAKSARKELLKQAEKLKFMEFQQRSPRHAELLYRECCHLVKLYMDLCEKDRSYNTVLCGIMNISGEKSKEKLKNDIYETAILLPPSLKLEEELGIISRAAREMYEVQFPGEGGMA